MEFHGHLYYYKIIWRLKMRAFLGIDFYVEAKAAISELQRELKKYAIKGRWKHYDNFHITLKFFEEINSLDMENIDRISKLVGENNKSFKLELSELGVFDGRDDIRVLWMGLGGETDKLSKLQTELDLTLENVNFEREKRNFKPHITIGQNLMFNCNLDKLREINKGIHYPEIYVNKFQLFKSEQIGPKRVYTKIEEYKLSGLLH